MKSAPSTLLLAGLFALAGLPTLGLTQQTPTVQVAPRTERVLRAQQEQLRSIRLADANAFQPTRKQPPPNPIAAGGFCVVTLHDHQQWIPGEEKIQASFDGQSYRFPDYRLREVFAASPERYVPVLKGDCPVTFAVTGRRVAGDLTFGLLHQNRVYFFRGVEQLESFRSNPAQYADVDLANQGLCVVSQQMENKRIKGLPQTVAIVDGRRYLFANAHMQSIFASNPARFGVKLPQATSEDPTANTTSSEPLLTDLSDPSPGSVVLPFPNSSNHLETRPALQFPQGVTDSSAETRGEFPPDNLYRGQEPPAMSGYCAVSIRKHGVWVRGKSNYFTKYDDRAFLFTGPEELQSFREAPQSFNPVLSGDCIVAYRDRNVREPGSPFHSLEFQSRLYLFADQESKQKFRNHLADYEHADLAFNGNCTVTQAQDSIEVTGRAELETQFRGKRYRFASQEQMETFLKEPLAYADP